MNSNLYLPALFICSSFLSCASWQNTRMNTQLASSSCNHQNTYDYGVSDVPKPMSSLSLDTVLTQQVSRRSLNVANAIGIINLLTQYVRLKVDYAERSSIVDRMNILELKQEIAHRISDASLVISAVSSELDCEEERTSQVANFLKGKESDLESKLTMGAIVIGASGAIATGGTIRNEGVSNAIGISTGVVEATLGLMMLFNNRKTDFYHARNALKDIWEGPNVSQNFPAFIWYYLNTSADYEKTTETIREQIIKKWKDFGQISDGEITPKFVELYFGNGGRYSTEQLDNRADMYDQLESQINLMKQELMALSSAIDQL